LQRLIQSITHPQVTIYLHLDKKSTIDPAIFSPDVKVVKNRVNVTWSSYSQVQATLNSLSEILKAGSAFDYVALISGQDYPITPVDQILSDLERNKGKEFMHYVPMDDSGWKSARIRFERFHFIGQQNLLQRLAVKTVNILLDRLKWKRKFYGKLAPFGGSSWWTLSRPCIEYILDYLHQHPSLVRFMKLTIFADEMIFQSIIMDSEFATRTVNNNFRHIEWSKGNPNPNILISKDFDKIINSGCHFARKFDTEVDEKILDRIDMHIKSVVPDPTRSA